MKSIFIILFLTILAVTSALPIFHTRSGNGLSARDDSTSAVFGNSTTNSNTPSPAQVQAAVSGFASDAKIVSAALNSLPTMTDGIAIAFTAAKAFAAESDEDSQRAVLAAAAGSAGSSSNAKIVKNTPVVLNGLKAIRNNPLSVKTNVNTMQTAR
ncbi:hypothetical protein ACMFMG_006309 [Clarireedia jacksonii]